MSIALLTDVAKANDKYRTELRSTWVSSPADTSLLVKSVPDNVPTIVTVGWGTDVETVFSVEGKSGSSSADYALTGVVRLKGANVNLPENTAVNCLNHEEFFNQYEEKINEMIETLNTSLDEINTALNDIDEVLPQIKTNSGIIVALTDGATPALDASLGSIFTLSAAGNRTIAVPTNPTNGQKIIIIHHADGAARTLALNTGAGGFAFGEDITELDATTSGKRDYIGCVYNATSKKWHVVAVSKGY